MKKTPIKRIGKVGKRRAAGMARFKRKHPRPEICPNCGHQPDFRGMAVHHKTRRSQMGDESDENLEWLCGCCHDAEGGIKDA